VLPIIEANVYGEHVVIASEYAPDGSLEEWLKRHGRRAPSVETAVEMTRGILAGLAYLHERKIIHRDLKPANILLQGTTPRITDFGISRILKSTGHSAFVSGTPVYMAPEAFEAKRNQQTDLWSVGVVLYRMLAGRLPFAGHDWAEIYGMLRHNEPEPLPDSVPAWLQEVVVKALAKNLTVRYQSATEMQVALAQSRQDEEKSAQPSYLIVVPLQPQSQLKPQPNGDAPNTVIKPQVNPQPAKVPTQALLPHNLRPRLIGLAGCLLLIAMWSYWVTRVPGLTENLNGIKLEMIRVPAGQFMRGSPESDQDKDPNETPQHKVTVPSFYISKYEVTQAQWKAVMGKNPSQFQGDDDRPVESVSWKDAKEFCGKLSKMAGKVYRLPSEAEWEYACRAKTTGGYAGDLTAIAWYGPNSNSSIHPVGRKSPNNFGLYDMHGNVWEWCEDVYHDSYGGQHGDPPTDGGAWITGGEKNRRVLRGGSWSINAQNCRSAARSWSAPDTRYLDLGFRVVVSARTQ
jgi:eukaryotic-like serine/threonine-protein kinase